MLLSKLPGKLSKNDCYRKNEVLLTPYVHRSIAPMHFNTLAMIPRSRPRLPRTLVSSQMCKSMALFVTKR